MDRKSSILLFSIVPATYQVLALLYIVLVIQPTLYFHHVQPPFLVSADFLESFFEHPGGPSELAANFLMQSFYSKFLGPVVLFIISLAIMWSVRVLLDVTFKNELNRILALVPFTLAILLTNNYNLPFSIIVSMVVLMLLLLILAKQGKSLAGSLILYAAGAVVLYYFSGSGWMMLFSLAALILSTRLKRWRILVFMACIVIFSSIFPRIAVHLIFPLAPGHMYLYFFPTKIYFMAYEPSGTFYLFLLAVPALLAIAGIMTAIQDRRIIPGQIGSLKVTAAAGFAALALLAFFGHRASFRSDGRKVVASDYYCYIDDAAKTARAATTLKDYNFAANLNYNLAMSKAGTFTENYFNFFQIAGTDALHPDVEFSSEMSFITADYYYDLGYISEARHWAYESLVFYPFSPRALQILVKIHLVTGEYRAAERCLNILSEGLVNRKFVAEYTPFVKDTALVRSNRELMEKRSFIPAQGELNPFISRRFQELLEANPENKRAYEHLMLYYLLDSQLDNFMELFKESGKFFQKPVEIFEEALLMYADRNDIPVTTQYQISPVTLDRYNDFKKALKQYEGNKKMARNVLYWEMGKSYMYYLYFVFPQIIKPEIITEEDEEPPI
jgi:hypothetical protein